jgi:hypothetical protein
MLPINPVLKIRLTARARPYPWTNGLQFLYRPALDNCPGGLSSTSESTARGFLYLRSNSTLAEMLIVARIQRWQIEGEAVSFA